MAFAGDLDTSFDVDGLLESRDLNQSRSGSDVALAPGGKLVVAGTSTGSDGTTDLMVTRYNADGSLDATFGTNGRATADFGTETAAALAVAVRPDGRIVAAGTTYAGLGAVVASFNANGTLDTTFSGDGKAIYDQNDISNIRDVAIAPDGKIVAAARGNLTGAENRFTVIRINTNGDLDTSFSGDGIATASFGYNENQEYVSGILVNPDGTIVAAGTINQKINNRFDNAIGLARFRIDGTLDPAFGGGDGLVIDDFEAGDETDSGEGARAIAAAANGGFVVAGTVSRGYGSRDVSAVR